MQAYYKAWQELKKVSARHRASPGLDDHARAAQETGKGLATAHMT
jgi:hypothetical protein